jgi:phosphoribosyl 1,2-cyclic phosphate phosphodiesterase
MELIFLGTGTSQGVPMIAQPEGMLDINNSKNWRTRSSVHVVMDGVHIQVDASPEFRLQCLREDITQMDYFLLTHSHADHILGMDDLRRFCDLSDTGNLTIYCEPADGQRVLDIFPYAVRDTPVAPGYPAFVLKDMPDVLDLECGTISKTVLPHGNFKVNGYVFTERSSGKKIAYYTDCVRVPGEAEQLAKGSDVVVLDATLHKPHPAHMSIAQACDAALRIGAPKTYFTHMSFYIDHDVAQSKLPEGIYFAWDGLRLTI